MVDPYGLYVFSTKAPVGLIMITNRGCHCTETTPIQPDVFRLWTGTENVMGAAECGRARKEIGERIVLREVHQIWTGNVPG